VVEIVDIYHAYQYLWSVGNAVFGTGSAPAAGGVEPLKDRLYEQGAAPVLAALEARPCLRRRRRPLKPFAWPAATSRPTRRAWPTRAS